MSRMANGITSASFMPLWATKTFAFFLGYLLVALGLAVLLGLKTRLALVGPGFSLGLAVLRFDGGAGK
jgi:uncharacterized membrane protein YphA (DoxX/SURF4 family)